MLEIESHFIEREDPSLPSSRVRLHLACCGPKTAPPLLMVHGFPEFWLAWRHQLREFSRTHRCHAMDLRGFNLSSQPKSVSAYHIDNLLADLDAVVQWIEAGSGPLLALLGHDWGGALAWSYAARYRSEVRRLMIFNAPPTPAFAHALAHDPEQIAASQYMNWLCAPKAEQLLAENDYARLFAMLGRLDEAEREAYRQCWSHGLTGACNYYRASPLKPDTAQTQGRMAAITASLDLERFRVDWPTCVVWGMQDQALRPALLEGLEAMVPDLRIHRIQGAGHWLLRENALEVNQHIREFLSAPPLNQAA